jgi:hypothetical protein
MTALRTTLPEPDRRRTARIAGASCLVLIALGLVVVGVSGCGRRTDPGSSSAPDPYRPLMAQLPPPESERIEFDAQTRTLTFYDLPASGRWMVRSLGTPAPSAAGPDHRLPQGFDPDTTFVYYRRPGGQSSGWVSVAEIQAARELHASQVR